MLFWSELSKYIAEWCTALTELCTDLKRKMCTEGAFVLRHCTSESQKTTFLRPLSSVLRPPSILCPQSSIRPDFCSSIPALINQ